MSKRERTIYVVTSGEYSCYGIDAVFDAAAMAEQYRQRFAKDRVEEYSLNPAVHMLRKGLDAWRVDMARDGTAVLVKRMERPPHCDAHIWLAAGYVECHTWARDEQHAVKIANERRAQLIASNQWPAEG